MGELRFDWSSVPEVSGEQEEDMTTDQFVDKLQHDPELANIREATFALLADMPIGRAIGMVITVILKALVNHEKSIGRELTIAEERALIASFGIHAFGA